MIGSPVYERTLSAFPISVGTSLALESVFEGSQEPIDPNRIIPNKVDINDYKEIWINLKTIFRNFYNAIPRTDVMKVGSRDSVEGIQNELLIINEVVNLQSNGNIKLIYYYPTYENLEKELKGVIRRPVNTPKQKHFHLLEEQTLNRIIKLKDFNILEYDTILKTELGNRILILTHIPVDLLSYRRFKRMDLLESHTGILKHYDKWYTKYYNGKDLSPLPFNGFLLKIFGDDTLIQPYHFKIRRLILEVAQQHKWTYITTMEKIYRDLQTIKDHFARNEIIKLI